MNQIEEITVSRKIKALCLACLAYREDALETIKSIFPGTLEWVRLDNGKHAYGLLVDPGGKEMWVINRGTGGKKMALLQSWGNNFDTATGENDIADGCEKYGNLAFNHFKHKLEDAKIINNTGHSKGGHLSFYNAKLQLQNLGKDKHVYAIGFAVFPWCREASKEILDKYETEGRFRSLRINTHGDPSRWPSIREKTDAVDVGPEEVLGSPIDNCDYGPLELMNHSTKLYVGASAVNWISTYMNDIDRRIIGETFKKCVN